ncbi:alpha/beta hydrolase [Noviherbaspirillum cavernae]|uniref:Alpha/beta hydrolase n=1 Tax=Noviherbaspirillum cavernae TaxID=2320862 RepID=A0A418WW33_9BURK|nr:alpha/beta hydrolase [Noviherbaspirillum cavernae]RJF96932.1 alpha/beta hydrolase [Noviherbaspirillum cavernae]
MNASSDQLQASLSLLDQRFAERSVQTASGTISCRTCGKGPATVVLLHGIGSGAASWLRCALQLEQDAQVIAWNAPGYGRSTPMSNPAPSAADYAARLAEFLDALGIARCVLVGHSLGAMMASAFVSAHPGRVSQLVLLSPAQGYGSAAKDARGAEVLQQRLGNLETQGIAGMAERSPDRMLSPQADEEQRAWVRWNTSLLDPAGYTQAVHMLCGDDIHRYPPQGLAGRMYCGSADVVTTPEDSRMLATEFAYPFALIDRAGHACYVEQPDAVATAIRQAIQ